MTTHILTDRNDDDFEDSFKGSEPRRCMFDLEGQCNNDPVEGHFIQKGLLKLIQDSQKRVILFYHLRAKNWEELGVEYPLNHPISPNQAATREFLCDEHEKFFWAMENPAPEWDNSEHKAKLAYRAFLINRYMKEWFIDLTSRPPYLSPVNESLKEQLLHAARLEATIRDYLNGTNRDRLRHTVARIPGRPIIAASGVIFHPLLGSVLHDSRDGSVIPAPSSPIVITVLPTKKAQMAMFSYASDGVLNAKALLDALGYHDGFISTAKLSKKLLEEIELIQMSPRAWASLGKSRQEFIKRYVMYSFGTSETDLDISPSRVDLFGAANRR